MKRLLRKHEAAILAMKHSLSLVRSEAHAYLSVRLSRASYGGTPASFFMHRRCASFPTNKKTLAEQVFFYWWERVGSNHRSH